MKLPLLQVVITTHLGQLPLHKVQKLAIQLRMPTIKSKLRLVQIKLLQERSLLMQLQAIQKGKLPKHLTHLSHLTKIPTFHFRPKNSQKEPYEVIMGTTLTGKGFWASHTKRCKEKSTESIVNVITVANLNRAVDLFHRSILICLYDSINYHRPMYLVCCSHIA